MQIIRNLKDCPEEAKNSVVALGNFDGIHLGHKAVIQKTIEISKEKSLPSAIMTFEPHPITVLRPDFPPFRITPLRNKIKLIDDAGIDNIFLTHFNKAFSFIEAEDFIKNILLESLNVKHVIIGYDFIFGHNRKGNAELLTKILEKNNVSLTRVNAVTENNNAEAYSSTKIRNMLRKGEIQNAKNMLGHSFIIEGRVKRGEGRGRKIGFHTANIHLNDYVRPALGVYTCEVAIEKNDRWLPAISNLGKRPTFNGKEEVLEVHIFDFDEDLYQKRLCVKLIDHIRPEIKFDGIEQLKKQIEKDCLQAKSYFKNR